MQIWIQKAFAPLKRVLPGTLSSAVRRVVTAAFTPYFHYYRYGFLRSALGARAIDRFGFALPWYTYPCIDFLRKRQFGNRHILEFGAGQSTAWWSRVAASVTSLEADTQWLGEIQGWGLSNTTLHLALCLDAETCVSSARQIVAAFSDRQFDIIIVDGLYRAEMVDIAIPLLRKDGAIICDDSEGYGFVERFKGTAFRRVDFYGARPGVVLIGCTSIFFRDECFLFENSQPIESAHMADAAPSNPNAVGEVAVLSSKAT